MEPCRCLNEPRKEACLRASAVLADSASVLVDAACAGWHSRAGGIRRILCEACGAGPRDGGQRPGDFSQLMLNSRHDMFLHSLFLEFCLKCSGKFGFLCLAGSLSARLQFRLSCMLAEGYISRHERHVKCEPSSRDSCKATVTQVKALSASLTAHSTKRLPQQALASSRPEVSLEHGRGRAKCKRPRSAAQAAEVAAALPEDQASAPTANRVSACKSRADCYKSA
eukprot:s2829_g3.t2